MDADKRLLGLGANSHVDFSRLHDSESDVCLCNLKLTKWPIPKLGVIGRQLVRLVTETDDVWPLRLVTLGRMTFEV